MSTQNSGMRPRQDRGKQPFCYRTPVRFSDVDHAGIVYHPKFFHYFHITFEEFARQRIGLHAYRRLLDEDRVGLPIVHAQSDFQKPLRFGDLIEIAMSVAKFGEKSIHFRYVVDRIEERSKSREQVAVGSTICAVVDLSTMETMCLPQWLVDIFEELVEP